MAAIRIFILFHFLSLVSLAHGVSELTPELIRREANGDYLVTIDCSRVQSHIERWWQEEGEKEGEFSEKIAALRMILDEQLPHYSIDTSFGEVGGKNSHLVGYQLTNLFTSEVTELAYLVHEAVSSFFRLDDAIQPYEDHKMIYNRMGNRVVREWSGGSGKISAHSDDLYERDFNIHLLALTTCRDHTQTSTSFYQTKHLIERLSDDELQELASLRATFISGMNVVGEEKWTERPVLELSSDFGLVLALDFRDDEVHGKRMRAIAPADAALLEKIEGYLSETNPFLSTPQAGTYLIVLNRKGIHARGEQQVVQVEEGAATPDSASRLLFRSKGPRHESITR